LVGAAFLHCAVYGVNQLQVQRYLTVPTVQAARKYANFFSSQFLEAKFSFSQKFGKRNLKIRFSPAQE